MEFINVKEISDKWRSEIKDEIIKSSYHPRLAIVQVGDNPASDIYIRNKIKACQDANIFVKLYHYSKNMSEDELVVVLSTLSSDDKWDGVMLQLPLPNMIDEFTVSRAISCLKDVDGMSPQNQGLLLYNREFFTPCTPKGIIKIIEETDKRDYNGLKAVVIGRSNIVGRPMFEILQQFGCTTTLLHSFTKHSDLVNFVHDADVVVSAVGKAKFIKSEWFSSDTIVIDVGMNRDENGKLCGDVDVYQTEANNVKITPVPGGVGPMTITALMSNVLDAYKINHNLLEDYDD